MTSEEALGEAIQMAFEQRGGVGYCRPRIMRPRFSKVRDQRDGNHAEIVEELRSRGLEVIETERPLDCLVFDNGWTGWMEIKTTARNAMIKRGQLEFIAATDMPVAIVKTAEQALRFIKDRRGYTPTQKAVISGLLVRNPGVKQWHPAAIERVLNI